MGDANGKTRLPSNLIVAGECASRVSSLKLCRSVVDVVAVTINITNRIKATPEFKQKKIIGVITFEIYCTITKWSAWFLYN